MTTSAHLYISFCANHRFETNPYVLDVLHKEPNTENHVLNLAGNNRLQPVQRLDDTDVFALSNSLDLSQGLTALDLSYNNITDDGVKHLVKLIEGGVLRSLDLTFNDIGADGAELLSQSLQGNSTLLSLTLSGNKLGKRGGMSLANLLQYNNTLQALYLANCDLDVQSVIAFAIALRTNHTLRCLDISRSVMFEQQEWAVHFGQMLALNQTLQELYLGLKGIMSTGMERLSKGLLSNHSLKYLSLYCNRVTRDDVQPLVNALLRKSSCLEVLDLSHNQLRDEGAVCLSEALASPNCSLKQLSLCSNNIRSTGLLALAKVLSVNSTLTHFYIWGNHFDEQVCLAFRDLIQSGRLPPDNTDVRAYEVDGCMFLAYVAQNLRKQFYEPE